MQLEKLQRTEFTTKVILQIGNNQIIRYKKGSKIEPFFILYRFEIRMEL